MNITFLAHKLDQGGGSSFSLDLMARKLSERGHSITILTTNIFTDNNPPELYPYDLVENTVDANTLIGAFRQIKKLLEKREGETDIYHIFNPRYLPIAGLYRRTGSVPTVGRLNSYDAFCTNPAMMDAQCYKNCTLDRKVRHDNRKISEKPSQAPKYLYRHFSTGMMNNLDRIFALSPSVRNIYAHNRVDRDLIEVIPNFYDPSFKETKGQKKQLLTDDLTLLYVGRLRDEKGVDILVDAMSSLDAQGIAVNIVGEGPQRQLLENQIETHDLSALVKFHGRVDHSALAPLYSEADVFVHPGRWPEPFGRTVLEAMQCNTPLLVSNIGAPPWIVGNAGMVFDRNDPKDLRELIASLQESRSKLTEMKSNCSDRLQEFAPNSVIQQIENQYKDLSIER